MKHVLYVDLTCVVTLDSLPEAIPPITVALDSWVGRTNSPPIDFQLYLDELLTAATLPLFESTLEAVSVEF